MKRVFWTLVQISVEKKYYSYSLFFFIYVFNLEDISSLNMPISVYIHVISDMVWSYLRYHIVYHAHGGLLYNSFEAILVLKLYSSSFSLKFSITFSRFIYDYRYFLQWFIFNIMIRSSTSIFFSQPFYIHTFIFISDWICNLITIDLVFKMIGHTRRTPLSPTVPFTILPK